MINSIILLKGKNYDENKSIYEQDLLEHGYYMKRLLKEGKLLLAGPFTDNTGGQIILKVEDEIEATEIMNQDPAVMKDIFSYEFKTWDVRFKTLTF